MIDCLDYITSHKGEYPKVWYFRTIYEGFASRRAINKTEGDLAFFNKKEDRLLVLLIESQIVEAFTYDIEDDLWIPCYCYTDSDECETRYVPINQSGIYFSIVFLDNYLKEDYSIADRKKKACDKILSGYYNSEEEILCALDYIKNTLLKDCPHVVR